jgi:hypothetical protein
MATEVTAYGSGGDSLSWEMVLKEGEMEGMGIRALEIREMGGLKENVRIFGAEDTYPQKNLSSATVFFNSSFGLNQKNQKFKAVRLGLKIISET